MRRAALPGLLLLALVGWLLVPGGSGVGPRPTPAPPDAPDPASAPAEELEAADPAAPGAATAAPPAGASLAGRVVLVPAGVPAEFASVELYAGDARLQWTLTERDGSFAFEDLPAGPLGLRILQPGRAARQVDVALAAGQRRNDLLIGMERGGRVFGTVLGERGTPWKSWPVVLQPEQGESVEFRTNDWGEFDTGRLGTETWRLQVEGAPEQILILADGGDVRREITLPEPASLELDLRGDEDCGVNCAAFGIRRVGGDRELWWTRSHLLPGDYEIRVEGETRRVRLAPGDHRTEIFRIDTATLSGVVVDEEGRAQPRKWVQIVRRDRPFPGAGSGRDSVVSDRDGAFLFRGLVPGRYAFTASLSLIEETEEVPVVLAPGETRDGVRLVLRDRD